MNKSYIDGKIFLLFPKNKNIAIYQDETNQKELNQQRNDNLLRLSKEDKNISPHTIEIYKKSLREIIIEESFEDMNKYINSILNKTFPKNNIKEAINDYSNKEFEWKYIFGDRDYSFSLNGYSLNFVPCDYNWETNKKDKELQFKVKSENWKINEYYILITIEFKENFSVYSHEINNCMNWKHFAHRLYYSIEYSPFFKEFRLLNESSYIKFKNDEYSPEEKIQRIDFGFYDDLAKIQNKMNNLYEDEIKGDLLKLEETADLISYDGHGNYCKEINGRIYKSTINFDPDIPIPEIFEEYFTHVEWFNR